jgi:hypothetical protein
MPSAEFEPAIPAIKGLQTYALNCTATGIGYSGIKWRQLRMEAPVTEM